MAQNTPTSILRVIAILVIIGTISFFAGRYYLANKASIDAMVPESITKTAQGVVEGVTDAASDTAAAGADTAQDAVEGVADAANNTAAAVADTAQDAVEGVADAANDTAATVANTAQDAVEGVADAASDTAAAVANTAQDAVEGVTDAATSLIPDALSAFTPEGFDADKIIGMIDGADISDVQKTALTTAINAAKDNPDLISATLTHVKAALGL